MNTRISFFIILITISFNLYSQVNSLTGNILNEQGEPLPFATAVLLDPADSTLEYYGISDKSGKFELKNVRSGNYLMQVAYMGYLTIYKEIRLPRQENQALVFAMKERSVDLDEVEVVGEAIPLMIKGDTVEYNRAAYKLREDDVVEDLLKKLPGVEVDRSGNIKALGEDVNRVYVDGKEFFGNDPKMATKNIPAKAVDKVQMYDKKSDESEFTGIDDGTREKSLNLVLEEDMKNMIFGNVLAGGGSPSLYEAGLRAFYYTDRVNLAALGMLNNNNNPGFSFSDYMNFSGGIGNLSGGMGKIILGEGSSLPVNFGQAVYGKNTAGAAGLNASWSKDKFNRSYISYMANASRRDLMENSYTRNYTASSVFEQTSDRNEYSADTVHSINMGFRKRPDSTLNINFNGNISLNRGTGNSNTESNSMEQNIPVNRLTGTSSDRHNSISTSAGGSVIQMLVPEKTILKLGGNLNYNQRLNDFEFNNIASFFDPATEIIRAQYQDEKNERMEYGGSLKITQRAGNKFFMESNFRYNRTSEFLDREQGNILDGYARIDSLSPAIRKNFTSYMPGLGFRFNTEKTQVSLTADYQVSKLDTRLNGGVETERKYGYILPGFDFDKSFKTGRRLSVNYRAEVNEPTASQLLPVANTINPVYIFMGNPELEPESSHQLNTHLFIFDQFSFTSLFAALSGRYTINKINWARTMDDQLVQTLMPVNVNNDLNLRSSIDFSTPVRKLGIKIHLNLQDVYNRGISPVNGTDNLYTSFSHDLSLSVDNRKKQKWDVISGVGINYTDSRFSIQNELDNQYYDVRWFGEINFTPNKTVDFFLSADLTSYNDKSFTESILVPLLNAEVNFHLLKSGRATLSLRGNDLLNRDTGIERISELNYLREIRRNTLGRYFMLSLKFRLNRAETSGNNFEVEIHDRRR